MGSKSAQKQVRVAERRQQRNKSVRSQVKTNITRAEKIIFSGELEAAREAVVTATSSLDKAAEKVIGKPLNMSQEDILRTLDPVAFVEGHDVVGGPAPKEVLRTIGVRRERLAEFCQRQEERKARLEKGDELLDEAVHQLIAGVS